MAEREQVVVELDREAREAAKAAGLDLSTVLLEALHRKIPTLHAEVRAERTRLWEEEHREGIEAYNRFVEEKGLFSDGARSF